MIVQFLGQGYVILREALLRVDLEHLRKDGLRRSAVGVPVWQEANGVEQLFCILPTLAESIQRSNAWALIVKLLSPIPLVTRAVILEKNQQANWELPWHQDVRIAIREPHFVEGFGKPFFIYGTPHVCPKAAFLSSMLTVRIHLDDCDESNGAMQVVPGSHRLGVLKEEEIASVVRAAKPLDCVNRAGDIVLMNRLLLHSSPLSRSIESRRVIHLELSKGLLPPPLEWHECYPLCDHKFM